MWSESERPMARIRSSHVPSSTVYIYPPQYSLLPSFSLHPSIMPSAVPQNTPPAEPTSQYTQDPHLRQTESRWKDLNRAGDISARVIRVLRFMEELRINLPILLWAISWNVEDLISDPSVKFARTTLMVSKELPTILSHWFKPPRSHNQGIRTKAAQEILTGWVHERLLDLINHEMKAVGSLLDYSKDCLCEETLLDISFKTLVPEVQNAAPIFWKILRHAAYTPVQEARNTLKYPDPV